MQQILLNNVSPILFFFSVVIVVIWLDRVIKYIVKKYQFFDFCKNFSSYRVLLEFKMQQSYNVVYKDQIFIYSLNAEKLDDAHFQKAMRDFCTLTRNLLGEKLFNLFCDFYTVDGLNKNMCLFFVEKYDNDEVHEKSQDQLINEE